MLISFSSAAPSTLNCTDLCFAFWDVVDPRSSEEEIALLPRLFTVVFEPQDALDFGDGHGAAAETLLMDSQRRWESREDVDSAGKLVFP